VVVANELYNDAKATNQALETRRLLLQQSLQQVQEVYSHRQFEGSAKNPDSAKTMLLTEQETLVRLERALSVLENSDAIDRVTALEQRIVELRELGDLEAARVAAIEKAVDSARQIETAAG
jgi:hypothetical protein